MEDGAVPPVRMLIRSEKEGSDIREFTAGAEDGPKGSISFPPVRSDVVLMSRDGSKIIGVDSDRMAVVWDSFTAKQLSRFGKEVTQVALSPRGTYAVTFCRPSVCPNENVGVWNVATGQSVAKFGRKDFTPAKWPFVQWTDDESLACKPVTNEIHFFEGDRACISVRFKVRMPKVEYFAISKGSAPYRLATFSPVTKSDPGKAALYAVPSGELIAMKSAFRADEANLLWNKTGSAVLAKVTTEVDKTGRSYYGESNLFFMDVNSQYDQRIALPREGPIYDAQWAPQGSSMFVVVYGVQPARATMYNAKCEPVFDFGSGSWNCVHFSPHGRFLALCGFQSLPGDVEFWDRIAEKMVGKTRMTHTTAFSWAPSSRLVLASSTFPRLRVDNGYKIFSYDGSLLKQVDYTGYLLQAEFLPAPADTFPDRPASPKPAGWQPQMTQQVGGKVVDLSKVTEKKIYRPPGARGQAASFSLHDHDDTHKAGRVTASSRTGSSAIPGLVDEPVALTKSQKKNARKKKAQDAKKAAEATVGTEDKAEVPEPAADSAEAEEAIEKKLRALRKKLRRAREKEDAAKTGTLNDEAKTLVESIGSLEAEIAEFERKLMKLKF